MEILHQIMLTGVIFFPILCGILIALLPWKSRKSMEIFTEIVVVLNAVAALFIVFGGVNENVTLITFVENYTISFHVDGLGRVFGGLVSFLWPFATLYAFEYMEHDANEKSARFESFFGFYTMTFGITLAIAFAANILTMYCFYEMLTLVTVPLILFSLQRPAILAVRQYLYYSLGGAAFGFVGIVFLMNYGTTIDFTLGGVLDPAKIAGHENLLRVIFIMAFFGFSVKAAIFPLHSWLPKAGVAPTPVTALLHAVAVVKAGAFAVLRLIYYSFGTDLLKGTYAQYIPLTFAMFTIVFGCSMAVKEQHLKRRLAYSTVSNLSYILFGALIMSDAGMVGAMSHMLFHAVMKITSFFCVGAVMVRSGKAYVYEMDGMAKRMPKIMAIFTVSALALMGVPGLCGFVSKWNLAKAAVESGDVWCYAGIGCLLLSALLTAIYMLTTVIKAYFPVKENEAALTENGSEQSLAKISTEPSKKCDPGIRMLLPLTVFTLAMFAFGLFSSPIIRALETIAKGGM